MSEFTERAGFELQEAGLFDEDSDYEGMIGDAVMELVEAFSEQGHSGFSAGMTAFLFYSLVKGETLTPITNHPEEWMHIDENVAGDAITWQNRRKSSCFSTDGGKTYYDIDEPLSWWRKVAWRITRKLRINRRWERVHTAPDVS